MFSDCLQDEAQTLWQAGHTGPSKPLPVSPASLLASLPSNHIGNDCGSPNALLLPCLCPWYTLPYDTESTSPDSGQTPSGHHPWVGPSMLPISTLMLVMMSDISISEFLDVWSCIFHLSSFFSYRPAPRTCSVYMCWICQSNEARIKTWTFSHDLMHYGDDDIIAICPTHL